MRAASHGRQNRAAVGGLLRQARWPRKSWCGHTRTMPRPHASCCARRPKALHTAPGGGRPSTSRHSGQRGGVPSRQKRMTREGKEATPATCRRELFTSASTKGGTGRAFAESEAAPPRRHLGKAQGGAKRSRVLSTQPASAQGPQDRAGSHSYLGGALGGTSRDGRRPTAGSTLRGAYASPVTPPVQVLIMSSIFGWSV